MIFSSFEYLVFFIGTVIVSWMLAGRPQLRILFLLLASYYFYASNNGWLLGLILLSTVIDYAAGLKIDAAADRAARKFWLAASLVANLGILGYFKYANFFAGSVASLGAAISGHDAGWNAMDIILPVGISFYTFQSMSYTIDVYAGRLAAERSFMRFAFFVAFFPQLVAGPIVRARYFLHQIGEKPTLSPQAFDGALYLIFFGLFKKIVLADTLGVYADGAFAAPDQASALTAWLGLYAFTFQIYFDFSGYTDIALGCARLLGFRLPPNFRRPYTATSFTEFWRRWHISLSFWLRDYLYKPLGGNRKGAARAYANLMITMLLGGLWHGAAWTFVLWGGLHGAILALEKKLGWASLARDYRDRPVARFVRSLVVFQLVVLSWLPFRAQSWETLMEMGHALTRFDGQGAALSYGMIMAIIMMAGGLGVQWMGENVSVKRHFVRFPILVKGLAYGGLCALIVIFAARGAQPFVYFQF
jgi:alginate O-acetyltransferase complex protein AlgI